MLSLQSFWGLLGTSGIYICRHITGNGILYNTYKRLTKILHVFLRFNVFFILHRVLKKRGVEYLQ